MFTAWLGRLPEKQQERVQYLLVWGSLTLFVLLGTLALALDEIISADESLNLAAGDVATRDVLAPRSLTYESTVLTEQARQDAIERVQPVYDPNPDVTREQIRLAQQVTAYINEIRHDPYASADQRVGDLQLIERVSLVEDLWLDALSLPDARWDLMSGEVSSLVERTMQRDIRPDNLESTRNSLVNSVATRFSNQEAEVIVAMAEDLVEPNTFFNEELTLAREADAAQNIASQQRSFEQGQLIVRSGNIVSELDMEALRQFGLLKTSGLRAQTVIGACLTMLLATVLLGSYLERFSPAVLADPPLLALLAVLFLMFLFAADIFGQSFTGQPYLYPAAALALLLTTLSSPQLAVVASIFLGVLVGLTQPEDLALEMAAYVVVGSLFAVLSLQRTERLNNYFAAGVVIGAGNLIVVLAFVLLGTDTPALSEVLVHALMGLGNGLLSAGVALVALYVITGVMNLPTNLKLIELTDPKQALLQQLLRQAPGTYQHSLQVANLSELAAEAIGGNTQLIRVAAMYHDIGKMLNPFYFVENTTGGMNPHDDLADPIQSARVIIGHVTEGDKMARRANLPTRIRDFILEHHGTTIVQYFYDKAVEIAGGDETKVNLADFTYPGPSPRTRETAIMMLADGCESATRSRQPSSKGEIEEVVNTIFELRLGAGQLDDSGLTLNDLKLIRSTFIQTLQAMYHPRIAYKQAPRRVDDKRQSQIMTGIMKQLESSGEKKPAEPSVKTTEEVKKVLSTDTAPEREPNTLQRSRADMEMLADEEILDAFDPDVPDTKP
jgi:cyclic-di-AMP phosphodiesterase PgpH